ncbi:UDP-N-acetylglucosamine transferase subunit ALG14 homolog [Tachyglossus aculeatus]|uniref:UDP-N-acetylglucosamine transferase subunit ALG14 homolog n=1 Tax=Tachyglossus aculeatus TaxID=9261 RepID=UPI0018F4249F|nr:UDP-N-acetylglucosamine transferase subunit ALG14 homolog [Tachyglossus aculeatus]
MTRTTSERVSTPQGSNVQHAPLSLAPGYCLTAHLDTHLFSRKRKRGWLSGPLRQGEGGDPLEIRNTLLRQKKRLFLAAQPGPSYNMAAWGGLAGAGGASVALAAALVALMALVALRVRLVARCRRSGPRKGPLSLVVVAGSGGHTTEILRLLGSLSPAYKPRHYVFADTDEMSAEKICSFEQKRSEESSQPPYTIHRIPRSREVQQSWASSILTTLYATFYSLPLIFQLQPDLVLCNGPGTCVPICASALLLGILGVKKVIIVYVESLCRVETLSLSGKILYYFSDYFIVQWPNLKEKYPKSVYLGRIV